VPAPVVTPVATLPKPQTAVPPLPKPVETPRPSEPPAAPAAKNSNGGFSIARQLGLGVSRIVIDAGHGGHDPGAQARGVVEAELVLDIALRVEKLLQKQPGVEVVLTRRTDEFIALQERTAIANREGADLFLSIHANASSSAQAHGIETYFLNFASNLSAAAVAARENAASGQAMNELPDIVKAIALNNKLDESRDFATQIQHSMIESLGKSNKTVKDLGVKQAPFVVLIGASMPSVLAEISFVTNPQEARLLKNNNYRQRIADALFNAIRKYQASLKSITTVAQ
jgi:N-acetylmuramoyl-L-alanine amidase